MEIIGQIITTKIFYVTAACWGLAQGLKVLLYLIRYHKINFRLFVGTGGMPSSHSAFVSGLATVLGLEAGWASPVFMLSLGMAIVTMFDAAGVRRSAGQQAAILNDMMESFYRSKPIQPKRLKELLGHTPVQVFAGAAIGIVTAFWFY